MASQVSVLKLFDLVQAHRVTSVIYVAVRLGIAELLRGGPQTLGQLAKATGAHERSLGRLLTALSTIGICERTDAGSYALTEVGAASTAKRRNHSRAGQSLKPKCSPSAGAECLNP